MYILFLYVFLLEESYTQCDKWTVMGHPNKAIAALLTYRINYLSDIHGLQTLTDKHERNFVAHMKQGRFKSNIVTIIRSHKIIFMIEFHWIF